MIDELKLPGPRPHNGVVGGARSGARPRSDGDVGDAGTVEHLEPSFVTRFRTYGDADETNSFIAFAGNTSRYGDLVSLVNQSPRQSDRCLPAARVVGQSARQRSTDHRPPESP
jgi:hypothetical protein